MRAIVLAALLGTVVFADSTLKQKLGESKKKLAQVQQLECPEIEAEADALTAFQVAEPDLSWCECDTELGGLSSAVTSGNGLNA